MRRWQPALAALSMLAAAAPAYAVAPADDAFARFAAGDSGVDPVALRLANRARLGGTLPEWAAAAEAQRLVDSAPARALALAEAHLATDPLNLNALDLAEQALVALGRPAEAARRHAQILLLLRGITGGRDAASREQAWLALSPAEKDTTLALLGFRVIGETSLREGRRTYAMVTATHADSGRTVTLWIAVDDPAPPAQDTPRP